MKPDDDDILTAAIPEPDAEASPAERAHAKAFAELVDKALARRPLPPAMSADDRALLEVATVIRAASGGLELAASSQRSVVEDALRQAVGGTASTSLSSATTPISSARKRRAPWVIAAASMVVAAAALLLLWLRPVPRVGGEAPTASIPPSWKSRPSDALVGEIKPTPSSAAAAAATISRIDTIFADRLDGYRSRRLSGGKP